MKVMQVVSGRNVNGAIIDTLLLSRELVKRGHEVFLLCHPGSWISRQAAEHHPQVQVHLSEMRRVPTTDLRNVAALIRQRGIEVLHTHMSRAHSFGVMLRLFWGVPCVATAHNRKVQIHWAFNDRVIAISEASARFHRRYNLVRPSRISVIYNFINTDRFKRAEPGSGRRVREALGIPPYAPVIGTMGLIIPRKGIVYLVRALAQVLRELPEAHLVLVGEYKDADEYYQTVRKEAQGLGVLERMHFTGRQNDVESYLAAMDVFAHAALEETFGMAIVEAMAMRLPVVATATGGILESLRGGRYGVMVPRADPAAMADAILGLFREPQKRAEMADRAHRYVFEEYSPEAAVPRMEAVLQEAARRVKPAVAAISTGEHV